MRKTMPLTITCLLACFVVQAHSQSVPRDVQELRRAHQADEDDRHAIPERPRPPPGPPEKIYSTNHPFVCLGTEPWQPVYAKPDYASRIPNWLTQPEIAVTGNPVNGFLQILYYNGKSVFIPASQVHAYRSTAVPDATCTFKGKNAQGRPVFGYDVPHPLR